MEDGLYFLNSSRYIHLNGYKAGLYTAPEEDPWSSCGRLFGTSSAFDWVTTERTPGAFPGPEDYRRFVWNGLDSVFDDPFEAATAGIAFGSDALVQKILRMVHDLPDHPETPSLRGLRTVGPHPSPDQIAALVEDVFGDWSSYRRRRFLTWAMSEHTLLNGREIASTIDSGTFGCIDGPKSDSAQRKKRPRSRRAS